MDADKWDEYHAARRGHRGWAEDTVIELLTAAEAGRAIDPGCGAGRHTLWLANRGWQVTAVDFSAEALAELGRAADQMPAAVAARVSPVRADIRVPDPSWLPAGRADLITLIDVPLSADELGSLVPALVTGLAPGGALLVQAPTAGPGAPTAAGLRALCEPLVTLEFAGELPPGPEQAAPTALVFGRV